MSVGSASSEEGMALSPLASSVKDDDEQERREGLICQHKNAFPLSSKYLPIIQVDLGRIEPTRPLFSGKLSVMPTFFSPCNGQ